MANRSENAFRNIINHENISSGGGVGRRFVPTGTRSSGPRRAGDRFRRGMRSISHGRHHSGRTKYTDYSRDMERKSEWNPHSIQENAVSSTTTSPTKFRFFGLDFEPYRAVPKPEMCPEVSEGLGLSTAVVQNVALSAAPAMDRTNGENINIDNSHRSQSGAGSCGQGGAEGHRRKSPEQFHQELIAHIRRVREKSKGLLHDVKELRYDLRSYPF